jgi:regulatory protein YycI of two-component signal transduction system YycFG
MALNLNIPIIQLCCCNKQKICLFSLLLLELFIVTLFKIERVLVAICTAVAEHIWQAARVSIEAEIQNQFSDSKLTSPVHSHNDAMRDMLLDQEVASDGSMPLSLHQHLFP